MPDESSATDEAVVSIQEHTEVSAEADVRRFAAEQAEAVARYVRPWAGPHRPAKAVSASESTCSERDAIAYIRKRVEHLIDLMTDAFSRFSSDAADEHHETFQIIQFLDEHLEKTGKEYLTPPEANSLLAEAGLLRDSAGNPGGPLRELLRSGSIPHAYQPSGRGGRWFIPHSASKE